MSITLKQLSAKWKLYVLRNNHGMEVHILNFGGIITKMIVPNKHGVFENVVLGYKNLYDYQSDPYFFGALIGRVAGRIERGCFSLGDETITLEQNDGKNHLHGGVNGLHQVIWDVEPFEKNDGVGVKLYYFSKDGENSYPGNVHLTVTYFLNHDNQLIIDYSATTDRTTPLTLTNHTYFNLSGDVKDSILNHHVRFNSDKYLELNREWIPTGKILDVENTTFDFLKGRKLRDGITADFFQNKLVKNGYDHYFLFNDGENGEIEIIEETSGRVLQIVTNQPGMVMYTGNNLESDRKLAEGTVRKYLGVCFETQGSPAYLHYEGIPSILLEKGKTYHKQTSFKFEVMRD